MIPALALSPPPRIIAGLGRHRVLAGLTLDIRPLGPADADGLQAHVRGMSAQSRRDRYLGGVNELPAAEIARLIDNRDRHVFAFMAEIIAGNARTMVAETVLAFDASAGTAEFALSVADEWQGLGLGTAILQAVVARADRSGAGMLFGETLRTNDAMLGLARKAGLALKRHPEDSRLVRLERPLAGSTFRR